MPDAEKVGYSGSHRRQGNTTSWGWLAQERGTQGLVPRLGINPLYPPFLGEEEKELGDTPRPPAGDLLLHLCTPFSDFEFGI